MATNLVTIPAAKEQKEVTFAPHEPIVVGDNAFIGQSKDSYEVPNDRFVGIKGDTEIHGSMLSEWTAATAEHIAKKLPAAKCPLLNSKGKPATAGEEGYINPLAVMSRNEQKRLVSA